SLSSATGPAQRLLQLVILLLPSRIFGLCTRLHLGALSLDGIQLAGMILLGPGERSLCLLDGHRPAVTGFLLGSLFPSTSGFLLLALFLVSERRLARGLRVHLASRTRLPLGRPRLSISLVGEVFRKRGIFFVGLVRSYRPLEDNTGLGHRGLNDG